MRNIVAKICGDSDNTQCMFKLLLSKIVPFMR